MRTLASLLAISAALSLAHTVVAAEPAVGDAAPDFKLQASDGKTYSLADFKGKKAIVIAWFPKAFTGGCTKECKSFKADGAEMRKFEVAYFTASCDDVETNTKFAKSLDLDYPILSDPDGSVAAAYGVGKPSKRWTFYISAEGKVLHVDKGVKTDTHGKDVGAKLKELGVPEKK
jgi:peroxiredoxin Q/BCP